PRVSSGLERQLPTLALKSLRLPEAREASTSSPGFHAGGRMIDSFDRRGNAPGGCRAAPRAHVGNASPREGKRRCRHAATARAFFAHAADARLWLQALVPPRIPGGHGTNPRHFSRPRPREDGNVIVVDDKAPAPHLRCRPAPCAGRRCLLPELCPGIIAERRNAPHGAAVRSAMRRATHNKRSRMTDRRFAGACACKQDARNRRSLLTSAAALLLSPFSPALAQANARMMKPQAGDGLVFAHGPRKGEPVMVDDLKV